MSIVGKSTQNYSGFSPALFAGCQLWLDSADSSTIVTSGTDVIQWTDKSGTGKVFNGIAGRYPQYTPSAINGLPSISFTGSLSTNSQYMDTSGVFNAAGALTYFAVGRQTVSNTFAMRCLMKGSLSDNFILFFGSRYLTNAQYFATNSGNFTAWGETGINAVQVATLSNTLLMGAETSSGTGLITPNYNGRLQTAKTGIGSNYTGMRLGDFTVTGSGWGGLISEIIVIAAPLLLLPQRQAIEGYLARKWGLSANLTNTTSTFAHPYRYAPVIPREFNPLDVSGCQLWLDAADRNTINLSGTGVTQWNDKSGFLRHATRLAASNPTYNASGFNGLPTITFSTSNCFTVSTPTNVFATGAVIFAVWVRTGGFFEAIVNRAQPGNLAFPNPWTMTDGNTANPTYRRSGVNNGYSTIFPNITVPSSLNNPRVHTVQVLPNAQSWGEYVNGVGYTYSATPVGTPTWNDPASNIQIGNTIGLGTQVFGNISEIIVYRGFTQTSMNVRDRELIERYLAKKWGLLSSFPSSNFLDNSKTLFPRYNSINVPSSSFTNCDIWFDAADTTTITGTTTVTSWISKGRIASLTAASTGACSSGNIVGGMNHIRCPAGTNLSFTVALPGSTGRNWIFVARQLTNLTTGMVIPIVGSNGSVTGQQNLRLSYINATSNSLIIGNGTTGDLLSATLPTSNTLNTVFMVFIGNSSTVASNIITLNGTSLALARSLAAASYDATSIAYRIGTSGSNTGLDIMELMYFNGSLAPSEQQQAEGYLARKWGLQGLLPSTHSFKNFTP